jgi:hypothetical protein
MTKTFTPRQWRLIPKVGTRGRQTQIVNDLGGLIAECDYPNHARLIAATPDLLAALRELVAKYDAQGHDSPELGKARAAIAKAEGQQ